MHILYFHQHFSTPNGATGTRSYAMAKRLIENGHQVTMVCGSYNAADTGLNTPFYRGSRHGDVDGIEVIEFDLSYSNGDGFLKRTGTFAKFALRSIGIALTARYDVVFATTTPLTASIPGIFARWLRGKYFIFEVRDLWPELPKAMGVITNPIVLWAMSCLEWISYHSANRCIALAPGIVDGIKSRGIASDKITLIPNGCDLSIFSGSTDVKNIEGVGDKDFVALFAGTHGIANGLDALLAAASELKQRGRLDIKFVLVGQGKLKPALIEKAKALELTNVVFLDPLNKDQLSGVMSRANLGLQLLENVPAFYYGTSPNKFFDYLSASLPVLVNYPGWVADYIEEYQCGFVVKPDSPCAFADALVQAEENRYELEQYAANAHKLAVKEFDRIQLAEKWVQWVTQNDKHEAIV